MNKDITPYNDKGQLHGYCKWYLDNGSLMWIGYWYHGYEIGYWELYNHNGKICYKEYFII